MVSTHGRKQGKNCKNLKAIRLEKRKRCEKYLKELLAKKEKREYSLYPRNPDEYEYEYEPDLPCSAWQDYLNCFYEESESEKRFSKNHDSSEIVSSTSGSEVCDGNQAKQKYNQYDKLLASDFSNSVKVKEENIDSIEDFETSTTFDTGQVKQEISELNFSDSDINSLITTMHLFEEGDTKEEVESDPLLEADTAFNFKHSKRKKFEYRSYLSPFEVKFVLDEKTGDSKNLGRTNLRSGDHATELEAESGLISYYQKHRRKKPLGPRHFQCSMCGGRFMSKGNLKAHCEIVHSNERNYECSDCGSKFKTKYHLKTHFSNIHRKNKLCPSMNNDQPRDQNRYPKRERIKISDKTELTCSVCNVILNNRRLLNMHMLVAHTKKSNPKNLKPKQNAGRRAYNLREITNIEAKPLKRIRKPPSSSSEEIRIFECNDCSAFYSSKCLLKNHILETHLFYHCEYPNCRLVFKKKANLQRHHLRVHTKLNPTRSKTKSPLLPVPETLTRSSPVARFECDYCKDRFPYKSVLAQHILRKHLIPEEETKTKSESFCNSGSTTKLTSRRNLGRPLDPTISQRNHRCNKCPMAFKARSHLLAHTLQRHSDERKFICTICNAQFKMKGILKTHMQRVHNKFKY